MAGVGRLERRVEGFLVPDFADQDHVGVLPEHVAERGAEREGVAPDFALRDVRHLVPMEELDRVLDGDDVDATVAVDVVEHRRERGRFAGAGDARDQHHAARLERHLLEHLGEHQLLDGADLVRDGPEGKGQGPALLIDVGSEPADTRHADGEVGFLLLGEFLDLARRHDLLGEVLQLLGADRLHRKGLEIAVHPHRRGTADLEQQVGGLALDHL